MKIYVASQQVPMHVAMSFTLVREASTSYNFTTCFCLTIFMIEIYSQTLKRSKI